MAFKPTVAIHPGQIVLRVLNREGLTQKNLSERTGLTEKHISNIINGSAPITVETALLLENVLTGTASFWINLQKNYDEAKARLDRKSLMEEEFDLLKTFPYIELVKHDCVPATKDKQERVENLWKFFGVNSLRFVQLTEPVAYRVRGGVVANSGSVASWLRCGELLAKKAELQPYSESNLRGVLAHLVGLTVKDPSVFSKEIVQTLASAGVAVVYVPHFKGTKINGSVRWIGENPVIQMTLFGAYADIFWFTLFHEIAHILLHSKKDRFIESEAFQSSEHKELEMEADRFAQDCLIPKKEYSDFVRVGDFTESSIKRFSEKIGIHSGLVAGRLARENILTWQAVSKLRTRLVFKEQQ